MVVIILEKVPVSLRGELTRWMLELSAGMFVGKLSAMVRERLWESACASMKEGGGLMLYPADNEQGFAFVSSGATGREVVDFDGLTLIRRA